MLEICLIFKSVNMKYKMVFLKIYTFLHLLYLVYHSMPASGQHITGTLVNV